MVTFGRLDNHYVNVKNTGTTATNNASTPNSGWASGNDSSKNILLSPLLFKNSQRRYFIKTDLSQPQSIGLSVNTNVHLKPKKMLDCKNFVNGFLFILLVTQGIFNHLEIQRLKSEVEVMKISLTAMEESMILSLKVLEQSVTSIFETIDNTLKIMKSNLQESMIYKTEQSRHSVMKRDARNESEVTSTNCSTAARTARSVSRGKHSHCKNRNGCHGRCYRTSGPLALHLRGALPEITVRDGGIIAPWYVDKLSTGSFLLTDGGIGERKGVVEVAEEGLYFVYAQIYYLTSSSLNSYAINVQLGEGRGREDSVIAVCSAEAATSKLSELSCFTATVRYLHRGDRIYVTQRERNRRIIFRDNQSYLGLILLNSHFHHGSNK